MVSEFDKNLNISYVDESLPTPPVKLALKHCLCSYLIYFVIYVILVANPFFSKFFINEFRRWYIIAYVLYLFAAPIIYLVFRPKSLYTSHNIDIFDYFVGLFKLIFNKETLINKDCKAVLQGFLPTYRQKQALMLMFIKVFYGTMMTSFLYSDIRHAIADSKISAPILYNIFSDFTFVNFKNIIISNADFIYNSILNLLFLVDVAYFSIGYVTEAAFLNNKIRTVDTNIFGVLVCVACYTPFSYATISFLGWNQNDNMMLFNDYSSAFGWALRFIALFFLTIYVSASVSLGTRASNLTNRGTVSRFPYNIVRHPAYACKNLFWFFSVLPLLIVHFSYIKANFVPYVTKSALIICSLLFWLFLYYLRAVTEERHLMQDPEYQEYAKKVKWRFIPYVF
ncbi:hypothetical protein J6S88_07115 [bacterium]|nr:hypothetical protein [bacterium]